MSPTANRVFLTLGVLCGILAISTASIFIKFTQQTGTSSIVIASARMIFAALALAPIALTRYLLNLRQITRRDWVLALLSGIFLALHFVVWVTSLEYTSVASSVVLVTTTPLWVALLSPPILHERVGVVTLLGLLLALTGGTVVGLSDACSWNLSLVTCPPLNTFFRGSAFLGDSLALFGAWMAAGYILIGRKLRAEMPLIPYIFIVYSVSALVLTMIMLGMGKSLFGYPFQTYLWLLLLALIPQLFGHSFINWILKYLPASTVSVFLLGEPVGSTILAYFVLYENPSLLKIIGGLLILVGIWIATSTQEKKIN